MFLKYIPDSGLSRFPLDVSECAQWQRCSRTCKVQKNHNILRKNTIINEHPVQKKENLCRVCYESIALSDLFNFSDAAVTEKLNAYIKEGIALANSKAISNAAKVGILSAYYCSLDPEKFF